ncbi:MAG: hypothetical protein GXO79_13560 [Chlorobi bacterium]|nr:hypothetical protein [Chlorobiota bacterium]
MISTQKIKISVILLISLTVLFSCKDEPIPETILPEKYLPVYPGSWWIYSNGETKTTGSSYVLNSYQDDIASPYETDKVFVPFWDGHYVYGYSITQNSTEFPLKLLLSEKKNTTWFVGRFEGRDIMRKTISKDISVSIVQYPYNNPVNCDTSFIEKTETIVTDTSWELVPVDECSDADNCDTVFVEDPDNGVIYPLFYEWNTVYDSYDTTFIDTLIVCDSIRMYDSVIVVKEYIEGLDEDTCWISKEYYAKNIGLIKREIGSCADSSASITDFEIVKFFINRPQ